MVFLTIIEATPDIILIEKDNNIHLTDLFGLPRKKTKDLMRIEVSVFDIEVDISSLIMLNQRNNLRNSSKMAIAEFDLYSMTLLNAQILIDILLFSAKVIRLDWVFIQSVLDFGANLTSCCPGFCQTIHQ